MNALTLKKGSSRKSAYNLRPNFSDVKERHTISVIVDNEAGVNDIVEAQARVQRALDALQRLQADVDGAPLPLPP